MDKATLARITSSAKGEWGTPRWVLEAVEEVLGVIDLDPCPMESMPAWAVSKLENADGSFALMGRESGPGVDAFSYRWSARGLFLNPPYQRGLLKWCDRLALSYSVGRVKGAIALLPARLDTQWWRSLWQYDLNPPFVVLNQRLRFVQRGIGPAYLGHTPVEVGDTALFPSALVYFGLHGGLFKQVFERHGVLYTRPRVY